MITQARLLESAGCIKILVAECIEHRRVNLARSTPPHPGTRKGNGFFDCSRHAVYEAADNVLRSRPKDLLHDLGYLSGPVFF